MAFVFDSAIFNQSIFGTAITIREAVKAATTTNGNLSTDFEDGDSLDNVILATGDRILLKDQTNAIENGIYIVQASGAPERSDDFATDSNVAAVNIRVEEGSVNGNTSYVVTNNSGSDIVGTDAIAFQQTAGQGVDGNVNGPVSTTDNAIVRWDGTTGDSVKNSAVLIDNSQNVSGLNSLSFDTGTYTLDVTVSTQTTSNGAVDIPDLASTSDTVALLSLAQTFTNKTITDTTNACRATELGTTGANVIIDGASPPSSGQVLTATSATAAEWQTANVFGTEWEEAGPSDPFINTGTTLVAALLFTTASKPPGTYRIGWYYEWALNSTFQDYIGDVTLDGTPIASHQQEPKDAGGSSNIPGSGTDQRFIASGFHYETFASASTHTILIRFAASQIGTAAAIDNARAEIWRVS